MLPGNAFAHILSLTSHGRLRRACPLLGVFVLLSIVATAGAYPTPSSFPVRWELEFQPGELRLYVDELENESYWYFTYTVINRTGRDQIWAPHFLLYSDAGEARSSGEDVPARITDEIYDLLGNELIQTQYDILGSLLQGREHAKEGLVIWPAERMEVTELSLFISGISGETARVENPLTGEQDLLRKTLQRNYLVPGDPIARGSEPAELVEQKWIFR